MKSIFVSNLSVSVTEVVLGSLFEAYGTVERVSIMTDRDKGQAKEFGFVDMSDDGEAELPGSSLRFATLAQRRDSLWAMFPSIKRRVANEETISDCGRPRRATGAAVG